MLQYDKLSIEFDGNFNLNIDSVSEVKPKIREKKRRISNDKFKEYDAA